MSPIFLVYIGVASLSVVDERALAIGEAHLVEVVLYRVGLGG